MFGELKTDLETDVAFAEEDPETTTISASPSVKWVCSTRLLESCRKPARLSIAANRSQKSFRPTHGWYSVSWKRECPQPPSVGMTGP
jgi:hypothetical protein